MKFKDLIIKKLRKFCRNKIYACRDWIVKYLIRKTISLIDEALSQIVPFSRTYYLGYTLYDKTRTSNKLLAIDVSLDKSTLLEIKSLLH